MPIAILAIGIKEDEKLLLFHDNAITKLGED